MPSPRLTLDRAIEQVRITHPCGRLLVSSGWGRSRDNSLQLTDHELWFVWRGRGWMSDSLHRRDLAPGSCIWMRPGGIYDAGLAAHAQLGFTYIHFRWPDSAPVPPQYIFLRDVDFFDAATRRIVQRIGSVPRPRWGQPASAPAEAHWLLRAVLACVIRESQHADASDDLSRHILRIAADLRDHPHRDIPVADLAAQAHVSAPHFSRRFRALLGSSPQLFQIQRRIEHARHLLRESNLSVTQIADQLGYSDLYQFSRQFRKHMGVAPTHYRRLTPGL